LNYEELDDFVDCIYVTQATPQNIELGKQMFLKYEQIIFQLKYGK
jgi:hypothetical protein